MLRSQKFWKVGVGYFTSGSATLVQITTPPTLVSRLIAKKMLTQITFKTNEYGEYD